jgi:hypothetical protein
MVGEDVAWLELRHLTVTSIGSERNLVLAGIVHIHMCTRVSLLTALAAAVLLGAVPTAGAAAPWSQPAGFAAGGDDVDEPVPRAAIAADGTSALAFSSKSGALMLATGAKNGRFGAARVIDRKDVRDYSIAAAPGGAFALLWEDVDGLHSAVRTKAGAKIARRRHLTGPLSEINGVQVAADPQGGWVVAERIFPRGPQKDRLYGVEALSLDRTGKQVGVVQDLGSGEFGIDARPTQALAVAPDGRAVLTFKRELASTTFPAPPEPVMVATRPHGGSFGTPVALGGDPAADPRVAIGADGSTLIAATQVRSRGDAGVFGNPIVAGVTPAGALGAPFGPALANPKRAFAPSATPTSGGRAVLVFQLKAQAEAFATEAPVRAVAIAANGTLGPLQTLTSGRAKEPVLVGLGGGRALTIWSGRRGLDARLAGPDGTFEKSAPPKGPPPAPFHTNSTNRDLRSAGRYAIFTWARDGRVRVSVRRF